MSVRSIVALVAAIGGVATALPAQAQEARSVSIPLRGYDLKSAGDGKLLAARIRRDTARVCDGDGPRPLREKVNEARCRQDAMAAAMPQFNAAIARAQSSQAIAANISPDQHAR